MVELNEREFTIHSAHSIFQIIEIVCYEKYELVLPQTWSKTELQEVTYSFWTSPSTQWTPNHSQGSSSSALQLASAPYGSRSTLSRNFNRANPAFAIKKQELYDTNREKTHSKHVICNPMKTTQNIKWNSPNKFSASQSGPSSEHESYPFSFNQYSEHHLCSCWQSRTFSHGFIVLQEL